MTTSGESLDKAEALLAEYGFTTPEPRRSSDDESEFTDAVVSERLVHEYLGGRWLWTAGMGWLCWSGAVWEQVEAAQVVEVARAWLISLVTQVCAEGNRDRTRTANGLLSGSRIKRVVELAQGQVLADADDFDADPDVLVVGNGVVDLRSGLLMPHEPSRLVTKRTTVAYRPGVMHSDWQAALCGLPEDVRDWFGVRVGQACTGHVPEDDKLILLQGGGFNGKSSVLAAVQAALGTLAGKVPDKVLLGSSGDHSTELMALRGLRLAVIEETPEARRLDVARLKKVLGTNSIVAREVYRNNLEFKVTHTLLVSSNYRPIVDETDFGTWRRLALVVFPYRYRAPWEPLKGPNDRRGDPGLRDRVLTGRAQQEAVLAWLVAGAGRWYAAGRTMPAMPGRIESETLAWREESDLVLAYMNERLVADAEAHIVTTDLTGDLTRWLEGRGHQPWSDRTVAARFGSHELAAEHQIECRQTRERDGRSRPGGRATPQGSPSKYRAWFGVRFRTTEDDVRGAPAAAVPDVPAVTNLSYTRALREVSGDVGQVGHAAAALHNGAEHGAA